VHTFYLLLTCRLFQPKCSEIGKTPTNLPDQIFVNFCKLHFLLCWHFPAEQAYQNYRLYKIIVKMAWMNLILKVYLTHTRNLPILFLERSFYFSSEIHRKKWILDSDATKVKSPILNEFKSNYSLNFKLLFYKVHILGTIKLKFSEYLDWIFFRPVIWLLLSEFKILLLRLISWPI